MAFTPLDNVLQRFLQQRSLLQISQASFITESWPRLATEILPAPLPKEIAAISFRQGTLLLRVPSNLAAQEVQFKRIQILAAYQKLLDGQAIVTKLRFRVVPLEEDLERPQPQQAHRTSFKLKKGITKPRA